MNKTFFILFKVFIALFLWNGALAQESAPGDCSNGYDDDLDGYVDCYDTDCGVGSGCEDFFIHPEPACTAPPTAAPSFNMRLQWQSDIGTAANNSNAMVADLDGDGTPEVVSLNYYTEKIFILDGETGAVKASRWIDLDWWASPDWLRVTPVNEVVIADIDRDGDAELFIPTGKMQGVAAFDHNLNPLWLRWTGVKPSNIGIADFDQDGLSEIYARDIIIDAHSGTRMNNSAYGYDASDSTTFIELYLNASGVAVDILPDAQCANCSGLELVIGGKIYSVAIDRGAMTSTLNLEDSIPHYPVYMRSGGGSWQHNRTGTSVADYNLDGYLDVITAGNDFWGDSTRYYFWDVHNGIVHKYNDPAYNWQWGAGRPNLADVDGDGFLDATFCSGEFLYAIDENWQLLWKMPIFETSSGNTGTTVFDFNGDGKFETVYRDEQFLYIVDGTTGTPAKSIACNSLTWTEYPIVADVDGDGATEICVTCGTSPDINQTSTGVVRVYEADGENWVTSRRIWNQHAYFNVNINDDGTVPIEQQKHHLVFSSGVCGPNVRPLNTFLNQSPTLTNDGCSDYAAGDLDFGGNVVLSPPACPNEYFTISFDISNIGDRIIRGNVPITFYDADPTLAGATKLNTVQPYIDLDRGETLTLNNLLVHGTGGAFTLYISINDDGSVVPPISYPISNFLECNYDNNVGTADIKPDPLPIVATKLDDDNRCNDLDSLANGAAAAFVQETYSFWFEDFDLTPTSISDGGATAWSRTIPAPDTTGYAEVVEEGSGTNSKFEVNYPNGESVWTSEVIDVTSYDTVNVSIYLSSESRDGDFFESDDYLRVYYKIDAGAETLWPGGNFVGSVATDTAGTGSDQTTLTIDDIFGATTLQIIVKFDNDSITEFYSIDNVNVEGYGEFTAGYTFNWEMGSVDGLPEYVGANFTAMADTTWLVYATNTTTGCSSDTAQIIINRTMDVPIITTTVLNSQTNCRIPNGGLSASAEIYGGEPQSDFTFEWYDGLDIFTSPVIAVGQSASGLTADTYTVQVTDKLSGCSEIKSESVPAAISIPVVDAFADANNSSCIAGNGAGHAEVSGKGVIYYEDFEDNALDAMSDAGLTGWEASWKIGPLVPQAYAGVIDFGGNKVFNARRTDNSTSNRIYWKSDTIWTQGITNLKLSWVIDSELAADNSYYTTARTADVTYRTNNTTDSVGIPRLSGKASSPTTHMMGFNGPTKFEYSIPAGHAGDYLIIEFVFYVYSTVGGNTAEYKIDNIELSGEGSSFVDNYEFKWYDGGNVKPSEDYLGDSITALAAGEYTVTATSLYSECTSDPLTITITDTLTSLPPTIKIINQNESCDPANPNATVSANVNGDSINYDFSWYAGQNTDPLNELSGSPAQTVTGLAAGIYTVQAVSLLNGCDSTAEVTIVDAPPTIAVNPNMTPSTFCVAGNGVLDANGSGGTAPYTYYWYNGHVGAPDPMAPDYTGGPIPNMPAGDYTVMARDDFLCLSAPINTAIADNSVPPNVTGSTTDQTSCDPTKPNGGLSANVGGTTAGYRFNVFAGSNTNPANEVAGSPAAVIDSLAAGIYTVLATDSTSGCTNTVELTVNETLAYPTVTASTTADQTICTTGSLDGEVTADVGGITAGYSFFWFDGNIGAPVLGSEDFAGTTYSGLATGDYTVVAVSDATLCPSNPDVTAVDDNTIPPPVVITPTHNSSCDTLNWNGQASANVGGLTEPNYEFIWFDGASTLPPSLDTGSVTTGLAPGTYTVLVTSSITGCDTAAQVTINDSPVPPVAATALVQDQSNCAVGLINGEVSANVGGATAGYTFYWFDGNIGTPDTALNDFIGINYPGLVAGDYTVLALDNATMCLSAPDVATVGNNIVKPNISATPTDNTSCDPANPNGQVTANVGGAIEPLYTFEWFAGSNTLAPVIDTASTVTNLPSGNYTVLVTEVATGCDTTEEITINDNPLPPVASAAVVQDQTNCAVSLINGEVTADVGGATAGYTFYWFDGNIGAPDTAVNDFKGINYAGLVAGDYTVVAVDDATLCQSAPDVATVGNNIVKPNITATPTDNTSCDTLNYNGQIVANVGGAIEPLYTFEWFDGTSTLPADSIGDNSTLLAAGPGVYTVLVTEVATGCDTTAEATVNDTPIYPVVVASTDSDNGTCSVGLLNGQVSADVGGVTAGYTFYWFDGNIGAPDTALVDFVGDTYSGITAGDYTVLALDNTLKCLSNAADVTTVGDIIVYPNATAIPTSNTSCDTFNFNGELSANVGGATAGYTFEWFDGQTTAPVDSIGNTSSMTGIAPGTYTVLVYELATGCPDTVETTVNDMPIYPVVAASTDNDQSNCAVGLLDGQVSADVGGVTAGYTFYWFDGNIGAPDTALVDFVGNTYSGITAGDYTVLALDNTLKCLSNAADVTTVGDIIVYPNATAIPTSNTSCDTLNFNGQISSNVGGATAGYTFEWFDGQTTAPVDSIGNTSSMTGIAPGTYTVLVYELATGCPDTVETTVNDMPVNPAVTAVPDNPNATCDPALFNGQVSANVSGATAGYTFFWFDGNIGAPDTALADYLGAVYSNLDIGDYTVLAQDNATKCVSAAADVTTVADAIVYPSATGTPTDNTSCDITSYNGQLTADVGGITAGYTFEWFIGQSTNPADSIGNTNAMTGMAPATYTVLVYEVATGCPDTVEVTINNNLVYPTVNAFKNADQSVCTVAALNGEVGADVGGLTAGYTFFWFDGNIGAPDTTLNDFVGSTYSGLGIGDYTVVAVDTATACPSNPGVETVGNSIIKPDIVFTNIRNNLSCDTLNPVGRISAAVNPGALIEPNYTFDWYRGANTLPANWFADSSTVTNIKEGTYTVLVTNVVSGCDSTRQVTISQAPPVITATPTPTHNTNCIPFNGQLAAAGAGGAGNYSYLWYNGNLGAPDLSNPDTTGINIADRDPGNYTLVVLDSLLCASPPAFTTINDNAMPPVVSATPINRTACDVLLTNGAADADVGGSTLGYDFEWFTGNNTNPVNSFALTPSVTNLNAGIFTVQVTNPVDGCTDTTTVTIVDNSVQPDISTATVDLLSCAAPDGSITISATIANQATDYLYELYAGPAAVGAPIATLNGTGNVFGSLDAGIYTVTAHHNTLGCDASSTITDTIDFDPAAVITITQNAFLSNPAGDCLLATGDLGVDVSSGSGGPYTYNWYTGDATSGMVNYAIPGTNQITAALPDRYTVVVIDNVTGCEDTLSMDLPYINAQTIALQSKTDQSRCDTDNGAIDIEFSFVPATKSRADYIMELYQGGVRIDSLKPATDPDPSIFANLPAGNYTVIAVDMSDGCTSNAIAVTIDLIPTNPVVTGVTAKNTYCVDGNGAIQLTLDGGAAPALYSFDWYDGPTTAAPALPPANIVAPGDLANALVAGPYTVTVTDTATGCFTNRTYAINDSIPTEVITNLDMTLTDQDQCIPPNGQNSITQVRENGIGQPVGNYTFTWYQSDRTTELPGSVIGPVYSAMLGGTYYVKATHNASSCTTDTTQFIIDDLTDSPFVAIDSLRNNTNCVGFENGLVKIDIDSGTNPIEYDFSWLEANGTDPLGTTTVSATINADSTQISNMPGGTFIVRVTDVVGAGMGCVSQSIINLVDAPPSITINDLDISHKTNCSPANGAVTVLDVREDGIPSGVGVYTFTWLQADGVTPLPGAITIDTYTDLDTGQYHVQAYNTVSGCASSATWFPINDSTQNPLITSLGINDNSNCIGINPNGDIQVEIDGGAAPAGYDFHWLEADGSTPLGTGTLTATFNADSTLVSELKHGTYILQVIDVNGANDNLNCASTRNFAVAPDTALLSVSTFTTTNKTNCAPQNGGGTVVQITEDGTGYAANSGDYDFEWFNAAYTTIAGPNGPELIAAIDSGIYYVKARNVLTNCFTPYKQFNVNQVTADPLVASTALVPNSNCGGINPDGQVVIQVDGGMAPADYNFHWFEADGVTPLGTTTLTAVFNIDSTDISQLPAGNYVVDVIDDNGVNLSCITRSTFTINAASSLMSISDLTVVNKNNCSPNNGSATVLEITENAVPIAVGGGNYDFEWFNAAPATIAGPNAGDLLASLDSGTYFVQARNTATNCFTPLRQFIVNQVTVNPLVASTAIINNSTCGGVNPDGQVTIQVDGGMAPANYNFHWFEADGVTPLGTTTASVVYNADSTDISVLPSGNYIVDVIDDNGIYLNCITRATFNVGSAPSAMSITDLTVVNKNNCSPNNGSATVLEITENAVPIAVGGGNYDFEWFNAAPATIAGPNAGDLLASLDSGTYFVQARNTATNCFTPLRQFIVNQVTVNPLVASTLLAPNSNCGGINPDGQITINIDGGAAPANYNFHWFEADGITPLGTTTATATFNADSTDISLLPAGNYVVTVIDDNGLYLNCATTSTFTINNDAAILAITKMTLVDKTNCSSDNGQATVMEITEDATIYAVGGGNYDFEWFNAAPATIAGPNAAEMLASLDSGTYFVQGRNTASNCFTPLRQFVIGFTTNDPFVIASAIADNTICGGSPNGQIDIDIDGGANPLDYTISWFEANGTDPLGTTTLSASISPDGSSVSQLPAGSYVVQVIDASAPNIGCATLATFVVGDDQANVVIANADLVITDQQDCTPPNGAITINFVREDGVPMAVANYTFEWFEADGITPLPGGITGPAYTGLLAGIYQVRATNTVTGCASSLKQLEIMDLTGNPFVASTSLIDNSNCGGTAPNGSVTIQMDGGVNPAEYNINWLEANGTDPLGTTTITASISPDGTNVTVLPAGSYVAQVTDLTNPGIGCATTSTFFIGNDQPIVNIADADLILAGQQNCNPPNGTATVTDVLENGMPNGTAAYIFEWFQDDGITPLPGGVTTPAFAGLDAGIYHVMATNTVSNCATSLNEFEIIDLTADPIIAAAALVPNTNCIGATPNGSINIEIDAGLSPVTDYTINWFVGNTTVTPLVPTIPTAVINADGDLVSQLPAGTYTVQVVDNTNPGTGCLSTATFTITDDQPLLQIAALDLIITDQDDCAPPNGSATVTAVRENNIPNANMADYLFEWLDADAVSPLPGGITGPLYTNFAEGTYYVRATNIASNCVSTITQIDIINISLPPFVTGAAILPNTTCGPPAIPDGAVTIDIDGGANPADYTVNWYESNGADPLGTTTTTAVISPDGINISQLPAGTYWAEVIDSSSPYLNCAVTSRFDILDDIATVIIARADVDLVANTNCVGPNGTVTINAVMEDSITYDPSGYNFTWMDQAKNILADGPAPAVNTLAPGTYFVIATNNTTNCLTSPPVQFEINDASVFPIIALEDFLSPTRCDGINSRGELNVSADNISDITQYTYAWYSGPVVAAPAFEPNNFFIDNLDQGDYTVEVTNNTTGCVSVESYTLNDEIIKPILTASSTHLSSCLFDDGRMVASVVNTRSNYDFFWYPGSDTTAAYLYTGQDIDSVSAGTYTVMAVDINDSFCRTRPASVYIYDRKEWPEIEIQLDAALTYCDPLKADGQLSASVNGDLADYNFHWYAGTDTTGTILFNGPIYTKLAAETFTIRISHRITGCSRSASMAIPDQTIDPPPPTIEVLSDMYSCTIPNGALRATVAGNDADFNFDWYNGTSANGSPDYNGSIYANLDIGDYTSTATDKETGCLSEPSTAKIKDTRTYPDFEVITENSLCIQPTGKAYLDFENFINYNSIEWNVDGQTVFGPAAFELWPGEHQVTVYGTGDCPTTENFTVGTDIYVYNGISPNDDGLNEIFTIGCIDMFINNNVRIYNRSGQLVFEMDNYDNDVNVFDGIGNRGIYLDTREVPDGTYFYVINKMDGSKPVSGYLEVMR